MSAEPISVGCVTFLEEVKLPPGEDLMVGNEEATEVITYVREGALSYRDSHGGAGLLSGGEWQRRVTRPGERLVRTNASEKEDAHILRIGLNHSKVVLKPGAQQCLVGVSSRRGRLCPVASPDGRQESLRIQHSALVFSTLLDAGQHVIHELAPERTVWLQLVAGQVSVAGYVLSAGDGLGMLGERSLSITALSSAEAVLVDVPQLVAE
jgi:redox-sensitive bicupin YhaK (pirin superfamily)